MPEWARLDHIVPSPDSLLLKGRRKGLLGSAVYTAVRSDCTCGATMCKAITALYSGEPSSYGRFATELLDLVGSRDTRFYLEPGLLTIADERIPARQLDGLLWALAGGAEVLSRRAFSAWEVLVNKPGLSSLKMVRDFRHLPWMPLAGIKRPKSRKVRLEAADYAECRLSVIGTARVDGLRPTPTGPRPEAYATPCAVYSDSEHREYLLAVPQSMSAIRAAIAGARRGHWKSLRRIADELRSWAPDGSHTGTYEDIAVRIIEGRAPKPQAIYIERLAEPLHPATSYIRLEGTLLEAPPGVSITLGLAADSLYVHRSIGFELPRKPDLGYFA